MPGLVVPDDHPEPAGPAVVATVVRAQLCRLGCGRPRTGRLTVCGPHKYQLYPKPTPGPAVDPDDYSHPDSDVRTGP